MSFFIYIFCSFYFFQGLVNTDGAISHHDLHDYLNLTNASSKKLFEPVWELLHQILNENEKELLTPVE